MATDTDVNEVPTYLLTDPARRDIEAWNHWRLWHTGWAVDLSRADLSGADLTDANLFMVNLRGANLNHANLTRANVGGSNLSHASLIFTNAYSATFGGSNMAWANLHCANLSCAGVIDTVLHHTNFEGVTGCRWVTPQCVGPFTWCWAIDTKYESVPVIRTGNVTWFSFETAISSIEENPLLCEVHDRDKTEMLAWLRFAAARLGVEL